MKLSDIKLSWVVITILVVIILLQRSCGGRGGKIGADTVRVVKVDTQYLPGTMYTIHDSVPYPVYVYLQDKPVPVKSSDTVFLPSTVTFDSSAIVKDYFTKRGYDETINVDSLGTELRLQETVTQNKVLGRTFTLKLKPTPVVTQTVVQTRNKVFAGLHLGGSAGFSSVGVSGALLTKSDALYSVHLDYTTLGSWYAGATIYWKIKLHK